MILLNYKKVIVKNKQKRKKKKKMMDGMLKLTTVIMMKNLQAHKIVKTKKKNQKNLIRDQGGQEIT